MANLTDLRKVLPTACDLASEKETRWASRTERRMVKLTEGDSDCSMPSRSDDSLDPVSAYASVILASQSDDSSESQLAVPLWVHSTAALSAVGTDY
jgi:hypothetical protein